MCAASPTIAEPWLEQAVRRRLLDMLARFQNFLGVIALRDSDFGEFVTVPHAVNTVKHFCVLCCQSETIWKRDNPLVIEHRNKLPPMTFTGRHYVRQRCSNDRISLRSRYFVDNRLKRRIFLVPLKQRQKCRQQCRKKN